MPLVVAPKYLRRIHFILLNIKRVTFSKYSPGMRLPREYVRIYLCALAELKLLVERVQQAYYCLEI